MCLVCPGVLVPQIKTGDLVKTQGSSLLDRVPNFHSDGNGGTTEPRRTVICSQNSIQYGVPVQVCCLLNFRNSKMFSGPPV